VFCSVVDGLRDRDNTIGDRRNALNAAGFEWVTSHTFRRTVATLMDQSGLSAARRLISSGTRIHHSRKTFTTAGGLLVPAQRTCSKSSEEGIAS
jgi:integrase